MYWVLFTDYSLLCTLYCVLCAFYYLIVLCTVFLCNMYRLPQYSCCSFCWSSCLKESYTPYNVCNILEWHTVLINWWPNSVWVHLLVFIWHGRSFNLIFHCLLVTASYFQRPTALHIKALLSSAALITVCIISVIITFTRFKFCFEYMKSVQNIFFKLTKLKPMSFCRYAHPNYR